MADCPLTPPCLAVNDPVCPQKPEPEALFEAVLLGCHAALFVEVIFELRRQHTLDLPHASARILDAMHGDIYEALHAAIAELATATHCSPRLYNLGQAMQAFFGAECSVEQKRQRARIIRRLSHLADASGEPLSNFYELQQIFINLSKYHLLPMDRSDLELTG